MKCAILISLYNAEETLDATFKSLEMQTFQDFRIIAINDHSTDATLSLIRKWQEKMREDRFIIIDNKENIGLTKSLNKGLSQITDPYTARIDADDTWDTTKLEKQIAYLEKYPRCGIIGTWYKNISSTGERKVTLPVTDTEIKNSIFKRNPFAHSCVVFRTELIKEAGLYDENARYGQDYELWLRLLPKTTFANIPEFLCFRNTKDTLSTRNQRAQMLQCIKTQLKYLKLHHRTPMEYRFIMEPFFMALIPNWLRTLKRKYL
jgi:glycosyltransferase involved in cell wall biosynthesis